MIRTKSDVVSNEWLNEDYWQITLDASKIASEVRPGQFIHVKISETSDPLFRRPFSVFQRVKLSGGTIGIQVVYEVVGRGTKIMTTLSPGDELDVIGPLGHGFTLHSISNNASNVVGVSYHIWTIEEIVKLADKY